MNRLLNKVFIHSFVIVLSISCVPMKISNKAKGDLNFKEEPNRNPAGARVEKLSLGKKIWTNTCSSCHTNESNGLPNKLYSSKADIYNGLDNIPNMSSLKTMMTTQYVDAVYNYLNIEAIEEIQNEKGDSIVSHKSTLGTNHFIASKLKEIYTSSANSTSVASINSIIEAIEKRPGAFGGTCVSGYDTCKGESTENYNAPMNISSNVIRRGTVIKVCRELHSISAAVTNVLDYCSIGNSGSITDADLLKAINAYAPGRSDSNGLLISQLKEIYSQAISKGLNNDTAWNMVLYSICRSTIIEKI